MREKIVALALAEVGNKEGSTWHKAMIDAYNAATSGYDVSYTDSWCATYISYLAIKLGITDIIPTECSCGRMIALMQDMGIWIESDAYVPSIGDIIFYDWGDSGSGDCTGWPEHVGIVTKVSGTTITVVEGNKSDAVSYRTMTVDGKYIRGYGVPKYDESETSEPETDDEIDGLEIDGSIGKFSTIRWQTIQGTTQDGKVSNQSTVAKSYHDGCSASAWEYNDNDAGSNLIKSWQRFLNIVIDAELKVDGKFGPLTINATQTYLNEVIAAGLKVDGEFGELSAKALQMWMNMQS